MSVVLDDELTPATAWDYLAVAGVFSVMLPLWASIPVALLLAAVLWTRRDAEEDLRSHEELP